MSTPFFVSLLYAKIGFSTIREGFILNWGIIHQEKYPKIGDLFSSAYFPPLSNDFYGSSAWGMSLLFGLEKVH
jgi:hypothetical protein